MDADKVVSIMMDQIVNPKCDDCGRRLDLPAHVAVRGPHECVQCRAAREREQAARYRDWLSQERPRNRTVHVMPKFDF